MSSSGDDIPTPPSPTSSVSSLPSETSSYRAPLSASFDDISIDGTSVENNGAPTSPDEVSDESKESALKLKSEANALFGRVSCARALSLGSQ
jgi:hypothetical protein